MPIITNETEYQNAVTVLDQLLLEVQGREEHELAPFLHTLGTIISEYEREHYPIELAGPIEVIKYLMKEHELTQADLPEIGNQAKVSEILNGKRKLNTRQIQNLSARFKLSPAAFF